MRHRGERADAVRVVVPCLEYHRYQNDEPSAVALVRRGSDDAEESGRATYPTSPHALVDNLVVRPQHVAHVHRQCDQNTGERDRGEEYQKGLDAALTHLERLHEYHEPEAGDEEDVFSSVVMEPWRDHEAEEEFQRVADDLLRPQSANAPEATAELDAIEFSTWNQSEPEHPDHSEIEYAELTR